MKVLQLYTLIGLLLYNNISVFSQNRNQITLSIPDSIIVNMLNGSVESIAVTVTFENNSNDSIDINQECELTHPGTLTGVLDDDYKKRSQQCCSLAFFVFSKDKESKALDNIRLSVADYVYFTKRNKLEYVWLEGIDNVRKIQQRHKISERKKCKSQFVRIMPNERYSYQVNIYLGEYHFIKGKTYFIKLDYNAWKNDYIQFNLSELSLESNFMKLVVE